MERVVLILRTVGVGKLFNYLKQEWDHLCCDVKQIKTNNQKLSLEYEEGIRVEGSKQTEVDPLWDFRDCAKPRIWCLDKTGKC